MRCSNTLAALVAALSISTVAAGPTHRHAHHHEKREPDIDYKTLDWNNMGIDWVKAYQDGQAAAASAAAASSAAAAAAAASATANAVVAAAVSTPSTTSSGAESIASIIASIWNNIIGIANSVTAFGTEVAASGSTGDFYYGNYGSPYGYNMMKVASRDGYSYTVEFINTSGGSISIFIWNKVGPDLQVLSGSALAPTKPTLSFALAAGASQIVAFQENSQVGWAQATSQIAASGAFATTWGEANFVKTGSGYDVSAIMNPNNNNYDMSISSTEAPQCTSDRTQNFWLTETQPIGDSNGSCYIAQSHATITCKMGGYV